MVNRMFHRIAFGCVCLAALAISACKHSAPPPAIDFSQPLPPGMMALRKIPPAEYPDFSGAFANLASLEIAIDHSLAYLAKPSSQRRYPYLDITHARAVATLHALKQVARDCRAPADLDALIRANFEVYKSLGAPDPVGGYTDRVLFTGYFTPIYEASLTADEQFRYPLHRRPADLVTDPATGQVIGRQTPGGIVPYYTRGQIEGQNVLAGQELVWLKNRFEAYVITVQGSARLRLRDGRILEVGYAGNNGYDYTSPGRQMLADGVLRPGELNIKRLKAYFDANPSAMDKYLWLNQRYIFFTESPGGPFGSLNVPVTPLRSIATDKAVYPPAMPAFLNVPVPVNEMGQTRPFQGFMLDQDTGGAIRAAGRCDIYMGVGPEAEKIAGHQLHEGELYYIAVKPKPPPGAPIGQ